MDYEGDFIFDEIEGYEKFYGQWKKVIKIEKELNIIQMVKNRYEGYYVNVFWEGEKKLYYEDGDYYIDQLKMIMNMEKELLMTKRVKLYMEENINKVKGKDIEDLIWRYDTWQGKGQLYELGKLIYDGEFFEDKFHRWRK